MVLRRWPDTDFSESPSHRSLWLFKNTINWGTPGRSERTLESLDVCRCCVITNAAAGRLNSKRKTCGLPWSRLNSSLNTWSSGHAKPNGLTRSLKVELEKHNSRSWWWEREFWVSSKMMLKVASLAGLLEKLEGARAWGVDSRRVGARMMDASKQA